MAPIPTMLAIIKTRLSGRPAIKLINAIIATNTPIEPRSLCRIATTTAKIPKTINIGLRVLSKFAISPDFIRLENKPANQMIKVNLISSTA